MQLSKFCPRCGEETKALYGDSKKLCADCYTDKHDLLDVPDKTEIDVCTVCGRMKHHGEWIEAYTVQDQLAEKFSDFGEEDVEMELQFWEEEDQMYVRVHAEKGPMKDSYDTQVVFKNQQCRDCSKFQGGFYKAKIQLRGEADLEPISNDIVDKAAELTNETRKDFLANVEKNDHGIDFYLSTEPMNKKILGMLRDRYEPEIERSYELVGEQNGEKVYRNVVSVRINQ